MPTDVNLREAIEGVRSSLTALEQSWEHAGAACNAVDTAIARIRDVIGTGEAKEAPAAPAAPAAGPKHVERAAGAGRAPVRQASSPRPVEVRGPGGRGRALRCLGLRLGRPAV